MKITKFAKKDTRGCAIIDCIWHFKSIDRDPGAELLRVPISDPG